MDGQNGWYAGQYPPQSQHSMQARIQQPYPGAPRQQPGSSPSFPHHASAAYHGGSPDQMQRSLQPELAVLNQSPVHQHMAGPNMHGDGPSSGYALQPTMSTGAYADLPRRDSASSHSLSGSSHMQAQSYPASQHRQLPPQQQQQQHHHHHYIGTSAGPTTSSSDPAARHLSNMPWEYQQRQQPHQQQQHPLSSPSGHPSAPPLQQSSVIQHAYASESPYGSAGGSLHRLSMPQSPMSEVFQRGAPPSGKTFDLMAGLETTSPAPPAHRTSGQNTMIDPSRGLNGFYEGDHGYGSSSSSGVQSANAPPFAPWLSGSDNGAAQQQLSQWSSAQPNGRSHSHPSRAVAQPVGPTPNVTSWNSAGAYFNVQPGAELPHAAAQSMPQSFAIGAPHLSSSITDVRSAPNKHPHGSGGGGGSGVSVGQVPMRTAAVHAPISSSGSSLDAAWGAPPSRQPGVARSLSSSLDMSAQQLAPPRADPGSPSLSVARNQSHTSDHYAQSSLHPRPPSVASSTLDGAMPGTSYSALARKQPALSQTNAPAPAKAANPTKKSRSKQDKRQDKRQAQSDPAGFSHASATSMRSDPSSEANLWQANKMSLDAGTLPRYASPSQIFARPPQSQAMHSAVLAQPKEEPLKRPSQEPTTPPLPAARLLAVQESPDPLNLLSPQRHFSLWQQPDGSPVKPRPQSGYAANQHPQPPLGHVSQMTTAQPAPAASSSKRKDLASTDKPKKKRSKNLQSEPRQPTFNLKVEDLAATPERQAAHKPKKVKKKEAVRVKPEEPDSGSMSQVFVEIPPLGSYPSAASGSANPLPARGQEQEPSDKKQKKKKRGRKSFSDLVNAIVEDSDSGMDAEGSDWDDLNILETWDASIMPDAESTSDGPKSLAKMSNGPVKSSHRKVPVAKVRGYMEDLFEADDSLPDRDSLQDLLPGQSISSGADHFFELVESPSHAGGESRAVLVLRAAALQRLLKFVVKCSRPQAEIAALSARPQSAANPGLATLPPADVTRLLAILERTVRVGEDVNPFPSQSQRAPASEPASPSKAKKPRRADRQEQTPTKTPDPETTPERADAAPNNDEALTTSHPEGLSSDEELEKLNATFAVLDRAVLAAECSLAILTGDVLPKQILSEEHIRSCFEAVKSCLDRVVLPFIEACSGGAATAPHPNLVSLIDILAPQKARKKKSAPPSADEATSSIGIICRNSLSDLFAHLCSALFFVHRMVRMPSIALSDSIVISAVYLALGPFFVLEPEPASGGGSSETAKAAARGRSALVSLGGSNSMKTLRLPALNLLRSIFAKAPDQRQWMIEEILTSLTKLTDMKKNRRQYSLRNGKGIHAINALLLQLIQAASHGVASYARSTADRLERKKDDEGLVGHGNDPTVEGADQQQMPVLEVVIDAFNAIKEPDTDEAREAEVSVWRRGLEGANQSARSIAGYLMQRIGQVKVAKSSSEMSHAYVIESLIQDLLSALFLPEWPAAALMLSAFCRVFGTYLEDPKSHPDAKGVALEQLSLVAARVRQSQLQLTTARHEDTSGAEERTDDADADADASTNAHVNGSAAREPRSPTKNAKWTTWDYLSMLRALREGDRTAIRHFVKANKFISAFLANHGNEDLSTEGALEFLLVQAQGELGTARAKAEEDLQNLANLEGDQTVHRAKLQHFCEELDTAMADLSELDSASSDLQMVTSAQDDNMLEKAMSLSERVLLASSSMITYGFLRDLLVEGLNNPLIANRSKALRGIDRIAQVDPDLLDEDAMRTAIEVRLRDSSNAVRDSAVALFGNYLLRKPQHIPKYYKQLAARVLDTGLSVRKRMVRLLKSIHEATDDQRIRIDSCARIVRCINDEDTVVQDMAVLTIGEMWLDLDIDARRLYARRKLSPLPSARTASAEADAPMPGEGDAALAVEDEAMRDHDAQPAAEESLEDTDADKKVAATIEIIMAVADVIKERPSPLEEVFRRLFKDKSETEAAELHSKLQRLGDSMIDSLVESSDASSVDTVRRIRIVQLLVSTNPAILTISKAKLLLPYLKAAQTSEEVQIMDLLLRIFRSCLPHMPKTALAFAEALEKSLRPLVNRPPPKAGLHLLQELIACYCAVITIHTRNFRLLIQTLKACFVRVQAMRQMALKGQKVEESKAWSTLMSLTASLCEHANFDEIRKKHPETAAEIDALSKRSLVDVVSEALLDIHKTGSEAVRSVALQNLGFIFRAHPTLMTRSPITAMMDTIFASGSLQDRATLLKIMLDFLSADALRRNPDNAVVNAGTGRRKPENPDAGSVDMTVLVGNTETFADTGVGSAMMQRYSEDVLKATLEVSNPALQRTAIDILRFTVLQGLSHPIQCVPYLVSLETLEDRKLRSRALELHSHLASKHASLVQARFLDTARSAFRFQLQLSAGCALRGYRVDSVPIAVLDAWYSLLRDRRATRLDFLKQIVKALDTNTAASDCSTNEVLFARFIADNLATLDYKTMEELLVVIGELRSILAVSGMQVLYMTQPHLPQQYAALSEAPTTSVEDGAKTPPPPGDALAAADLVSPFQLSRNPWLSGEWQLQLASDAAPAFADTVDPMQVSGQPGSFSGSGGEGEQAGDGAGSSSAPDREDDEGGSKAQVDAVVVARMSIISGTALLLRNHLKHLYGLSEARCAKFNPTKKQSAGADKPATMRALADPLAAALDLGAMPFGVHEVRTDDDARRQMLAYAAMVENEGTLMEPDDPEALDDLAL